MNVQGIPPLPAEAGECEIMYGKPIEGDLVHSLDGWRERAVLSVYSSPCWLIARPVPPKRLEWKRSDVDGLTQFADELEKPETPNPGEGWRLVDPAVDKPGPGIEMWLPTSEMWLLRGASQHDPFSQRVHYRIRKTPAVEVQWPEGAIALTKDGGGYMYFTMTSGKPGATWHSNESYKGQEPSQFNGKHFKDCFLINPACLPK